MAGARPADPVAGPIDAADRALTRIHRRRLETLGAEASGLFAHYQALVEKGSVFRPADRERAAFVLQRLGPYDHYVVLRAGLGEVAFALALAGRKVTAWDANDARRAAIQAGLEGLAEDFPDLRRNLTVAERDPASIRLTSGETSLGLAFDCLVPGVDETEAAASIARTRALLYEPAMFLRRRDPATAGDEVRDLLASAGFDAFPPILLTGVALATRGPGQPAVEPVRFRPAAPRPRPSPDGACQGLISLFGGSYCGSTLLTMLLGSHPRIAGGGELHWLTHPDSPRAVCALCGPECPVWTAEVRARIDPDRLYDQTAEAFGRPVVCDASKMPAWFAERLPRRADLPQTNVLVVKHPVRQVASFLHKARRRADMAHYNDPAEVLRQLVVLYHRALDMGCIDILVRYEDLVADPRATLAPILAHQGLRWSGRLDGWRTQPHHHVGGNTGALVKIDAARAPETAHLRRKYAGEDLFLDDGYLEVLDQASFAAIAGHPYAREICDLFGYGELPAPSKADPRPATPRGRRPRGG